PRASGSCGGKGGGVRRCSVPLGDGGGGAEGGSDEDDAGGDYEEYEDFSDLPDTRSIASDDSFYPPRADGDSDDGDDWSLGESDSSTGSPEALTLFRACCTNNAVALRAIIRQGPEEKEAKETDRNKRTGLIVACYQGFVDIVIALAQCPHIDVNWQDNEGNTALITAAQAGKEEVIPLKKGIQLCFLFLFSWFSIFLF
uniref:Uncharacterized protein n=1 Tax=Podarcis muralis TaxID=64176 RepID=A0A670IVV4_PODMU